MPGGREALYGRNRQDEYHAAAVAKWACFGGGGASESGKCISETTTNAAKNHQLIGGGGGDKTKSASAPHTTHIARV